MPCMMETTYAMKHQVRSADQVDEITAVRLKHQMLEAGRDQVRSADQVHGDTALEPLKDQVRSADQVGLLAPIALKSSSH